MIEPYNKKDYQEMREFYFQILYESRHFIPYTPTLDKGHFNSPQRTNFVVKREDKIVAHLTLFSDSEKLYEVGVAILKEHWGKGFGSVLLKYAEQNIKTNGAEKIVALIDPDNWRSILLFTKQGYKVVDEGKYLRLEKEL